MDIDWEEQARVFLEKHGWNFDGAYTGHPLFPLREFLPGKPPEIKFCETMYPTAWKIYKDLLESYSKIRGGKQE